MGAVAFATVHHVFPVYEPFYAGAKLSTTGTVFATAYGDDFDLYLVDAGRNSQMAAPPVTVATTK
ncbi:MAG: hypothetical protein R3C68_03150 [Myxococcota bacterium]